MDITIYHNPRCSKSRKTLALLEEKGVSPLVVEYLKNPLTAPELTEILAKMGKQPRDILRQKEAREEGIETIADDAHLILSIASHPRIMERPIVVHGDRAALGRPPEAVLAIL